MNSLISYAGVLSLFFFKPGGEVHWAPWFSFVVFLVIFCTYQYRYQLPRTVLAFFLYFTLQSCAYALYWPLTSTMDLDGIFAIRLLALTAAFNLVLFACLLSRWRKARSPVAWGLYFGGLFHAVSLIIDQAFFHIQTGVAEIGLLGNRSIGASFTAIWVFFVAEWTLDKNKDSRLLLRFIALPVGVLAVLCSNSGISYAALICGLYATYMLYNTKWGVRIVGAFLPIIGMLAAPWVAPRMFGDNARYPAWKLFFEYWYGRLVTFDMSHPLTTTYWMGGTFNRWFGSGGGSFPVYGPSAQLDAKFLPGRWFLWAHNDWLQIGLEYGLIGLALSLAVYYGALKKARHRPWLFGGLVCFGIVALGNYPLEIASLSLIGFWLFVEAFL